LLFNFAAEELSDNDTQHTYPAVFRGIILKLNVVRKRIRVIDHSVISASFSVTDRAVGRAVDISKKWQVCARLDLPDRSIKINPRCQVHSAKNAEKCEEF